MAEMVLEEADITMVRPPLEGDLVVDRTAGELAGASERDERGMTTAEYAVGIIAACALAGVLFSVFQLPEFKALMAELVSGILKLAMKKP